MKSRYRIRKTGDRFRVEQLRGKKVIKSFSLSPKKVFHDQEKTKVKKNMSDQELLIKPDQ